MGAQLLPREVALTRGQETTRLGRPSVRASGPCSSGPGRISVPPRAKQRLGSENPGCRV